MTQKLINQMIKHYEKCLVEIEKIEDDQALLFDFVGENRIEYGLCYLAKHKFNTRIACDDWIEKVTICGVYIDTPPILLTSKAEIIDTMKKRIEVMKTFKSSRKVKSI